MSDQARSAETVKPVFVDNRDGNTLARAITIHLAALRSEGRIPAELCVASCHFNPQRSPRPRQARGEGAPYPPGHAVRTSSPRDTPTPQAGRVAECMPDGPWRRRLRASRHLACIKGPAMPAGHDDPAEGLSLTRRRSYDRRGASAGHHHVGFRCATSEDLGGR